MSLWLQSAVPLVSHLLLNCSSQSHSASEELLAKDKQHDQVKIIKIRSVRSALRI